MEKEINNLYIDEDGEVIFTDANQIAQDTNWFDWDDKQKEIFSNQWNQFQNELFERYGFIDNQKNIIVEDEYISKAVNLITELEKENNLSIEYGFDSLRTREQINEFLSSESEYIDPLINSKHTRNIEDLKKDYHIQNDYGDIRNVTFEDIKFPFDDLGNKTITPYKDFADVIDEHESKINDMEEGIEL